MPPGIVNLLWIVAESEITDSDLARAEHGLRGLVERKADDFFTRREFAGTADFLKQYGRLSGMLVRHSGVNICRPNPMARNRMPAEIIRAIAHL